MSRVRTERHWTFTETDIREMIAAKIKAEHGMTVDPKTIKINVKGSVGDPYGDDLCEPAHLSSVEVVVITDDVAAPRRPFGGGGAPIMRV